MLKKLAALILAMGILSGCSKPSPVSNSLVPKNESDVLMDNIIKKELEDKDRQEEETRQKVEQEAKAEAEANAKAEQDAKAQKAATPAAKPVSKLASVRSKPKQTVASTTTVQNGTSSSSLKHPVEYKADIENEILVLVNQERSKVGAKPLAMNETLRSMARYKSNDMLQYDYFDHTSPSLGGPSSLAKKFSYSYTALGENIWMSKASSADYLRQNTTAEKIMNGWMNSSGHKANILNPAFGKIGVGVTFSTDGFSHATQEFSN